LLIGVVLILILIVAGVFAYPRFFAPSAEETAEPLVTNTTVVDTGANSVGAEGVIVPLRDVALAFAGNGQVAELLVEEGEDVTAGASLLRLDSTDEEIALTQAQAALNRAEANVAAAEAGVAAAEIGVQAAELGVRAANVELSMTTADPTPEQVALQESQIALATAQINQAVAGQSVVLEGPLTSQIRAGQVQLDAAEAQAIPLRIRLDELRVQDNPDADALDSAERQYAAAQARIEAARLALEELQAGATAAERQAAGGSVAAATAQRDAAQAQLELLLAGSQAEQVTAAEAGVRQAEALLAEAQQTIGQAQAAFEQAQAGVAQARAAVAAAEDALARMTLTAPFAGTVADLSVEVGEAVTAGLPVATLADFGGWMVETSDLTELDVVAIAVGHPVTVQVDAFPGEQLTGTVVDIAPSAQEVRGDVTYAAKVALEQREGLPLRWGMTVFVTAGEEAAAPLPTEVVTTNGTTNGEVAAEGVVEPLRSVTLSFLTGGTVAEVVVQNGQAVEAGETLIRLDARPLQNAVAQAESGVAAAEAGLRAAEAQLAVAQSSQSGAEAILAAAEAQLTLLQAGPRAEEIDAVEAQVTAAEAGVTQAAGNRDSSIEVSDAQIRAAEAEVVAAEAELIPLQEAYETIIDTCFELPDGGETCPLLGPPEETVRFQLQTAEARLSAARAALEEARGGPTAAQQQAADATVAIAVAQRNVAEARLALLLAGATPQQIEQAQVSVEQARLGLVQVGGDVRQAEAAVTQARAGLVGAEASLEAAQKALERMTLVAPFSGTVANISLEVGEIVAPGMPVAAVADTSRWRVRTTDLVELDVAAVAEGQAVEVTLDAIPGETLRGTVEEIGRVAELAQGDVTYPMLIALEDYPDLPLRWGMTALVRTE
jgi:HlyD family secretion protein